MGSTKQHTRLTWNRYVIQTSNYNEYLWGLSIDELKHVYSKQKSQIEEERRLLREITEDLDNLDWSKIHKTEESIALIELESMKIDYLVQRKEMMVRIQQAKEKGNENV